MRFQNACVIANEGGYRHRFGRGKREIVKHPAIGGFMLADRTNEHLDLFEEGEEAEYFASDEEYRDKLKFYLANHAARDRIARAGHERCMSSGYSYDDRIRCVLSEIRS